MVVIIMKVKNKSTYSSLSNKDAKVQIYFPRDSGVTE